MPTYCVPCPGKTKATLALSVAGSMTIAAQHTPSPERAAPIIVKATRLRLFAPRSPAAIAARRDRNTRRSDGRARVTAAAWAQSGLGRRLHVLRARRGQGRHGGAAVRARPAGHPDAEPMGARRAVGDHGVVG